MLLRVIPLPVHGALELAVGLGVAAAPFALGFGPGGILAGVFLGTTIAGLALGASVADGRDAPSIPAHAAYDRALAVALVAAGALAAVAGDTAATAFFAAAGAVQVALISATRYSAPG
jgi:hypothetical protein